MQNKMKYMIRAGLVLLTLPLAATAHAQMTAEDMIKARQSGYTFMAWNMGKINDQVVDQVVPYNEDQVIAAADAIAAIANSGMGALFAPGTEEGTGWKPTRVKPAFFEEQDNVGRLARNFISEANELQSVAQTGNENAIREQFKELGESCRACHQEYRADE